MKTRSPRKPSRSPAARKLRELNHLVSVGDAALRDFDLLGIESVAELAQCDPKALYEKLCELKGVKLDPCCADVFEAAVAQAKNPRLSEEKKKWSYYSRLRQKSGKAAKPSKAH